MSESPVQKVVFSAEQIAQRVNDLGRQISQDYLGKDLHLVGVLRGALPLLPDLARAISLPTVTFDFLCVRRRLGGVPELLFDLDSSIAGRHVLLVEDLVSEGRTLAYLEKLLSVRQPASLKLCSLIRRDPSVELAYVGWDYPAQDYLVGYGLDLEERWRHLPYIGVAAQP
jgi:hypoxanthine phosphoribosyltransferase